MLAFAAMATLLSYNVEMFAAAKCGQTLFSFVEIFNVNTARHAAGAKGKGGFEGKILLLAYSFI